MANSYISYTGDGSTTAYSIPFPFIAKGHLVAKVNGVTKTQDTDYTVSGSTLTFGTAPASSASIHISRSTPKDEMLVNFVDGAVITADDLDTAQTQTFYGLQEVQESSIQADPENYDAVERRIVNVADPEDDQDAATKAYVDGEAATLDAAISAGDAASIQRANHTGTQAISTITGLQTSLNTKLTSSSNGVKIHASTGDPTAGDDEADGYGIGDRWLNYTSNIWYMCADATEGAAVWVYLLTGNANLEGWGSVDPADLTNHTSNTSNPHSVTATQVGLGNVPNYGVASQAEAEAGTATDKLMTPLRVAQAIEELAPPAGGDVVGPASATDNSFARYDGTTGKLIQNSYLKEDDSGLLTMAGQTNGGDVPTAYRVLSSVDSGIGAVHGLYCIRQSYAPTTSEGASSGFGVGSRWIDTTTDKEYVCLDSTNGAAVWKETTGSSGGDLVSTNNLSDLDNAATARTNLGLAIGTDVQAYDSDLTTWAGKTAPSGTVVGTSDSQTLTNKIVVTGSNAQTGTTYTLVAGDASLVVTLSNASSITLTVPANSSVAFAVGTTISLVQLGAGQVTVAGAGGVTVNSRGSALKIAGQYGAAALHKTATDTWVLFGDLTT